MRQAGPHCPDRPRNQQKVLRVLGFIAPLTVRQLAVITQQPDSAVHAALKPLVAAGAVRATAPTARQTMNSNHNVHRAWELV